VIRKTAITLGVATLWTFRPLTAYAHNGNALTDGDIWLAWQPSASVSISVLATSAIYLIGMRRRNGRTGEAISGWRHASFFAGIVAFVAALQSPIDPVAERLFYVHQVQHLLLRMLGPMLIALAWPAATLIAGTPRILRRNLLAPIASNRLCRRSFGAISHPASVTVLFVAALYLWQIPSFHNRAILDNGVHYSMHASMFAAGLLFWLKIFERRSAPHGTRHGARVLMLVLVILSNIVLGSYTALKSRILYTAYDIPGRLHDMAPLTDEQIGGIIIWIPSSMMCLVAVLIVIQMYGRHEARLETRRTRWSPSNSAALLYPTTGKALVSMARTKNRSMAAGIAAFTFSVFAMSVFIGLLSRLSWTP
jgi:putative membrane protein